MIYPKAVFKFVVDTRFQLERKSSLEIIWGLATILQNWISCNEQKMREAHITRSETSFYLFMIFIEKISNRKLKHSLSEKLWVRFEPILPMEGSPQGRSPAGGSKIFSMQRINYYEPGAP